MKRARNKAKIILLRHLAANGWKDTKECAVAIGWTVSSTGTRLLHFWQWGLLERRKVPRMEYRLTEKGAERLAWLQRKIR